MSRQTDVERPRARPRLTSPRLASAATDERAVWRRVTTVALGRRKQIVTQEDLDNYILVYLQYGSFVYFKWDQSSNRFHLKLIVGLHY